MASYLNLPCDAKSQITKDDDDDVVEEHDDEEEAHEQGRW